ncbi:phage tail assembly chaperone [Alkaliphilus peptidifermentans]|uniref:Phage XkdN-like tail assembly chaperone protein, TAC n=1 Tax=Alkaliphilus peptidifermentans DSM 18978 TaxID=1120976 RepID=A0A1G5JZQ5_9FIRM|nr:phage portal protein [Alkaliphilus peptidifermentans]SCY93248.1 Phage XkdN-like tail assembly chaperone protein, TAC [Alkaliphilus peptidifermentans DSM 18978]
MNDLQLFFAQNVESDIVEEFVVSERFKNKEGKAVSWKIKAITEAENETIRKSATKLTKGKNGIKVPETSPEEYLSKLIVASVVFPNLKDAQLQKSYGVIGSDELIKKMLLAGEYSSLVEKIQKTNGFNVDINEIVDEVKN